MKRLLAIGVIFLFVGLALAPPINANIRELRVDNTLDVNDTLQLELEYQRIKAYLEMQSDEDCGCNNINTTEWFFPIICTLLVPLWGISVFIFFSSRRILGANLVELIAQIGLRFNCYWLGGSP